MGKFLIQNKLESIYYWTQSTIIYIIFIFG